MTFEAIRSLTLTPASAAIRQRRFVELDSSGAVIEVGTQGNHAVGVALEASAANSTEVINVAQCNYGGKAEVEAGAAVAAGAAVMSDNEGRVITASGATARVMGRALEAASAAGVYITVLLDPIAGRNG